MLPAYSFLPTLAVFRGTVTEGVKIGTRFIGPSRNSETALLVCALTNASPILVLFTLALQELSGVAISRDNVVVVDVMWLVGVLKPILDHRCVTKNKKAKPVREAFMVVFVNSL